MSLGRAFHIAKEKKQIQKSSSITKKNHSYSADISTLEDLLNFLKLYTMSTSFLQSEAYEKIFSKMTYFSLPANWDKLNHQQSLDELNTQFKTAFKQKELTTSRFKELNSRMKLEFQDAMTALTQDKETPCRFLFGIESKHICFARQRIWNFLRMFINDNKHKLIETEQMILIPQTLKSIEKTKPEKTKLSDHRSHSFFLDRTPELYDGYFKKLPNATVLQKKIIKENIKKCPYIHNILNIVIKQSQGLSPASKHLRDYNAFILNILLACKKDNIALEIKRSLKIFNPNDGNSEIVLNMPDHMIKVTSFVNRELGKMAQASITSIKCQW